MRIIDEIIDDRRIKKYGELAHKLKTSLLMLTGSRNENGIKIEELMVESKGDFYYYQDLIEKSLLEDYKLDFLDFSLLMGKFFGVYNEYCFIDIKKDVRKKIAKNKKINRENTKLILEENFKEIFTYFKEKFFLTEEEFIEFISSLFVVRDDYSLYNNKMVNELSYILMGNYLSLEYSTSEKKFCGCLESIEYFHNVNNRLNRSRVK